MNPVSPLKVRTKLDRTQSYDLYYAVDTQIPLNIRYLHFSGESLTTNKAYAWYGTKRQFQNLIKIHEWDALSLVNKI